MIVSYSRGFIFVKTKKTAGSTVEAVLSAACGPQDIITKEDAYKYPGSDAGWDGRELFRARNRARREREQQQEEDGADRVNKRAAGGFYSHMSAQEARSRLDPEFWNSALKLTIERHPYEKAVSLAYYRVAKKGETDIAQYLDRVVRKGAYATHPLWLIDGEIAVDEIIRQERLKDDLERIGMRLGIPIPAVLPNLKSRTRKDRRPAREILTAEQRRIVQETCLKEFELLGYEP